jgi:hypothetical protein
MLDVSDSQGNNGNTTGYVSQSNCAVIQYVDISSIANNYVTLFVNWMDGTTGLMYVKVIDGNPVNAITAAYLAKGDIIEYSVYQPGTSAANTFYSVTGISSKPYVTNASTTAYTYYIGSNTISIGIGYKAANNTQTNIVYAGLLPMSTNTTVIYFDGTIFENITTAVYGNINYQKLILANCSMYVSNGAGTTAKFIYVSVIKLLYFIS